MFPHGSSQVGQLRASSCPACHWMFLGLLPGGQSEQMNEPLPPSGRVKARHSGLHRAPPTLDGRFSGPGYPPHFTDEGTEAQKKVPHVAGGVGGDSCAWKPGCLTVSTTLCIICHYLDLASGCGYQPGYRPHLLAPCSDLRAVPRGLSASQAKGCGAMNAESGGHIPGGRPASHPGLPDTEGVPGM